MSSDCRTVLIPDEPSTVDDFGPHQRVADAVVNMISSHRGGQVVALEGRWGSGKTTVLNLVRMRLAQATEGDWAIASIDAWAHEGDPLRRTFLESLSSELNTKGWWSDDNHKSLRNQLAGRHKVIHRKSSPRLTHLGVVFSLAVLLMPLALVLSNTFGNERETSLAPSRVRWSPAVSCDWAALWVQG